MNKELNIQEINKQSRNWFFTINAHMDDDAPIKKEQIIDAFIALDPDAEYVFQLEQGEKTGYEHYQCALLLGRNVKPRRKDVIRVFKEHDIPDAFCEVMRKVEAAEKYCSKGETRLAGPWYSSDDFKERIVSSRVSRQGARTDLALLRKRVMEGETVESLLMDPSTSFMLVNQNIVRWLASLYETVQSTRWSREQREVQVHYIWGETGVGKTRYVYDRYQPSEIYVAHMGARDAFSNYKFQKILVLDEFRSQSPISNLLQMLDRYPYEIDRRYEDTWAAWTEVYILSNWPLDAQYRDVAECDRAALERRITDSLHFSDTSGDALDEGLWEEVA
jgi:hypothetical protein